MIYIQYFLIFTLCAKRLNHHQYSRLIIEFNELIWWWQDNRWSLNEGAHLERWRDRDMVFSNVGYVSFHSPPSFLNPSSSLRIPFLLPLCLSSSSRLPSSPPFLASFHRLPSSSLESSLMVSLYPQSPNCSSILTWGVLENSSDQPFIRYVSNHIHQIHNQ